MADPAQSDFRKAFQSLAKRVHRRHAGRLALTGASLGLSLGALAALGLWALRWGEWRPFAAGLGALGADRRSHARAADGAGRRRDVALYLDARLGSHETLTTALAAQSANGRRASAWRTCSNARAACSATPTRTRGQAQAVVALSRAAARRAGGDRRGQRAAATTAPRRPRRSAPGAERVQIENLKGLERIEALGHLPGQNPEQDERLKKLAEQAKKLREALAKGLEKREALSEIAKLRDGIAAERLKLGDRQNRPGLDAALRAFGNQPALRDAQKALGNGDLTAFDDEMQQLANRAESSDRQAAKDALEEAAKAARAKGAQGLADALDAQKRLFERRESHADALRELAKSLKGKLSPEALEDLKEFGSSGSPRSRTASCRWPRTRARRAHAGRAQAPGRAHAAAARGSGRQRLAHDQEAARRNGQAARPAKRASSSSKSSCRNWPSPSRATTPSASRAWVTPSAAARPPSVGWAPCRFRWTAMGAPGSGPGADDKAGQANPGGSPGPGSKHDSGTGDHHGSTPEIAAKELRSKADARLQAGAPMHGATLGRAPARPGETANQLGTGSLGEAQKTEVGAVDHADIPEEYREQVGRYFEP